jgi:cysteinyl-tRNA synthetase
LNNFITLKQAFSGAHERLTRSYNPLAIRQLILNSHYRSPLDFSDAALFAAQSGYEEITWTVIAVRRKWNFAVEGEVDKEIEKELNQLREKFRAAMNDDLNTSVALSVVFELVRLAQRLIGEETVTKGTFDAVDNSFRELGGDCLGIVKDDYIGMKVDEYLKLTEKVKRSIEQRNEARKQRNFALADAIRATLDDFGIVLEDKSDGTTIWRMK